MHKRVVRRTIVCEEEGMVEVEERRGQAELKSQKEV